MINRTKLEQENLIKLLDVHQRIEDFVGKGGGDRTYIGTGEEDGALWFVVYPPVYGGYRGEDLQVSNEEAKKNAVRVSDGQGERYVFVNFKYSKTTPTGILERLPLGLDSTKQVDSFVKACLEGKYLIIKQHGTLYGSQVHYIKDGELTLAKKRFWQEVQEKPLQRLWRLK